MEEPKTATVDYDGYEYVVQYNPFRPDIEDEIRLAVPQAYRRYDAKERAWFISALKKTDEYGKVHSWIDAIFEIFDVFGYSARDFTGDPKKDPKAEQRQKLFAAKRQLRMDGLRQQTEEQAKRKAQREAEEEELRTKRAEDARKAREEEDAHYADENARAEAHKAEMRARFFSANSTWATEKDFGTWWAYYLMHGHNVDMANQRFKSWHEHNQQSQRQRSYTWSNARDQKTWEDFRKTFQSTPKPLVHYGTLGIVETATNEEIKSAYLKLARLHHPSSTFEGAQPDEEKMKSINTAYDAIKKVRNIA